MFIAKANMRLETTRTDRARLSLGVIQLWNSYKDECE